MAKVDSITRKSWRDHPRTSVDLIIRVDGNVREHSATLEERGVQVKRRFRLTRSLGVRCSGKVALGLLSIPWITQIEPDRGVKALRDE